MTGSNLGVPMKVLLLVGGLGLRLRPIVADRPKPMATFDQKPFLAYQLAHLRSQGFKRVVLCAGFMAEQVEQYFGAGNEYGIQIEYSVEYRLLGTAGAIKNAARFIDGTFVVCNGDSFLDLDFTQLVASHTAWCREDASVIATIAAVTVSDASAYGSLQIDECSCVRSFVEKGKLGPGWVNGGAYVFEPELLQYIPVEEEVSLEKTVFPLLLNQGRRLFCYPFDGFFIDIGTPEGHQRFSQLVAEQWSRYAVL